MLLATDLRDRLVSLKLYVAPAIAHSRVEDLYASRAGQRSEKEPARGVDHQLELGQSSKAKLTSPSP